MHSYNVINYIEQDSPAGAEKVKHEVLMRIQSLLQHPQKCNPDKYKTNNDVA